MLNGKCGSDRTTEGMADENGLFHAVMIHKSRDRIRLRHGIAIARAALRPSMSGSVRKQHLGPAFQQRAHGYHLIQQIAACAVDEHHRGQVGRRTGRNMDVMDFRTSDFREAADRRIAPFDQPCADAADPDEREEEGEQAADRGGKKIYADNYEEV